MPRTPEQYRGMTRRNQLRRWLNHGGNLRFGNLSLVDVFDNRKLLVASTYGRRFALIESIDHVAHVLYELPYRSVTSSGHRNRVLEALEREGYHITEFSTQDGLDEIYHSIVGANPSEHLDAVEEIAEESLPAIPVPTPIATPIRMIEPAAVETAVRRNRTDNWYVPGGGELRYNSNLNWTISIDRPITNVADGTVTVPAQQPAGPQNPETLCDDHWTETFRSALTNSVRARANEDNEDAAERRASSLRQALDLLLNSVYARGISLEVDPAGRVSYYMDESEESDE